MKRKFIFIAIFIFAFIFPEIKAYAIFDSDIPQRLKNINDSNLPYAVSRGIKDATLPKENTQKVQSSSEINIQTSNDTKDSNKDNATILDTTNKYTIAAGIKTPLGVTKASTNLADILGDLIKNILNLFTKGNAEAGKVAGATLPYKVAKQNIKETTIGKDKNIVAPPSSANVNSVETMEAQNSQLDNSMMNKSLNMVECAYLPYNLCAGNNNRPLWKK